MGKLAIFLMAIFLISCTTNQSTSTPQILTPTFHQSTPTLILQPTATEIKLPYNPNIGDTKYCDTVNIHLLKTDSAKFSEDQVVEKLIELWLAYFKTDQAPAYCRIEDFHVDKVYYDPRTPGLSLDPQGDFMRVVQFSIKLIQIPNYWMSLSGEIDQNNWLHTGQNVAVFKTNDGYIFKFAYP